MAGIIYFEIGEADRIPLTRFIIGLKNFLGILEDLDSTISNDRRGSVEWDVVALSKTSPALIGVEGHPMRKHSEDYTLAVESDVIDGLRMLGRGPERHKLYSDVQMSSRYYARFFLTSRLPRV